MKKKIKLTGIIITLFITVLLLMSGCGKNKSVSSAVAANDKTTVSDNNEVTDSASDKTSGNGTDVINPADETQKTDNGETGTRVPSGEGVTDPDGNNVTNPVGEPVTDVNGETEGGNQQDTTRPDTTSSSKDKVTTASQEGTKPATGTTTAPQPATKPTTGTTTAPQPATKPTTGTTTAPQPATKPTTGTTTAPQPATKPTTGTTTAPQPATKPQETTAAPQPSTDPAPLPGDTTTADTICCFYITDETVAKFRNAYTSGSVAALTASERALYKGLKKALDSAAGYTSPVDKEKAVHDWIVLNTRYDLDALNNVGITNPSFSADGVFKYGKAVCDGYQKAFMLCMRIMGIECETVTGFANGQNHAWNMVKLDGEWYQVDVTWDDPLPDTPGVVRYGYFNITDTQMHSDHSYTCSRSCTGTKYSYLNYFNKVPFVTNEAEALNAIKAAVGSRLDKCRVYVWDSFLPNFPNDWASIYEATGCTVKAERPNTNTYIESNMSPDSKAYLDVTFTLTYDSFKIYPVASQGDMDSAIASSLSAGKMNLCLYADGISKDTLLEYAKTGVVKVAGEYGLIGYSYIPYKKGIELAVY